MKFNYYLLHLQSNQSFNILFFEVSNFSSPDSRSISDDYSLIEYAFELRCHNSILFLLQKDIIQILVAVKFSS